MKTVEILFGFNDNHKQLVINTLNKYYPNIEIEFRTERENPFEDDISIYGTIKTEEEEEKFQMFFSEYYKLMKFSIIRH